MSDFGLKPYTISFYNIFSFNFDSENTALSDRKVAYIFIVCNFLQRNPTSEKTGILSKREGKCAWILDLGYPHNPCLIVTFCSIAHRTTTPHLKFARTQILWYSSISSDPGSPSPIAAQLAKGRYNYGKDSYCRSFPCFTPIL